MEHMGNLIEFPSQNQECAVPGAIPNYSGHMLMLDLTKARKWQTANFWVGIRCRMAIVPEVTFMSQIHQAVLDGILIDITEHPELFVADKPIADVTETDTGKKTYSGTRQFFHDIGIGDPMSVGDMLDETVVYATDDPKEQTKIETALVSAPVSAAPPISPEEARKRASRTLIELPPGMDNPDKYLLSVS